MALTLNDVECEISYRGIPLDQAAQVRPQHLADYTKARGWRRVETSHDTVALYSHPEEGHFEQVLIPRDPSVADYATCIADAVATLAAFEKRSASEVLQDVLDPESDTIRFAWEGPETETGSIGFVAGTELLEGARRALLSAACSVLSPSLHHPRLSRTEADQLLGASRLHHTERGSFVVTVSCPLRAVDSDPALDEPPFTRKVTTLLMHSLDRLVRAIEQDKVEKLLEENSEGQAPISANLCEAILRMLPERDGALRFVASWAPTLRAPQGVPNLIRVRREYVEWIASIRDRLLPATTPKANLFVGTVETLNGVMGDDGRRSGEVTLRVLHEDEIIRLRIDLGAEQYAKADEAHMSGVMARVEGLLKPSRRVHRLAGLSNFEILAPSPAKTGDVREVYKYMEKANVAVRRKRTMILGRPTGTK